MFNHLQNEYNERENPVYLTKLNINNYDDIEDNVKIILETGVPVALRNNYKQQITLFKNNNPLRDSTWLIEHNGILCFVTQNAIALPVIIDSQFLQTQNQITDNDANNTDNDANNTENTPEIFNKTVIVVDTSASMGSGRGANLENLTQSKLGCAKKVLGDIIRGEPNSKYTIVPFNKEYIEETSIETREETIEYINSLGASGNTPLFEKTADALTLAIQYAQQFEQQNVMYKVTVIIITDGMASNNAEEVVINCKQKVSTFLELGDNDTPRYSSDVYYYYAKGEGGHFTASKMGITPDKLTEFHNTPTGVSSVASNYITSRNESNSRLASATNSNFREMARRS